MRRGVELLLRDAGLRVVGVAGTVTEARGVLERRRYDVVLLDVQLGAESSLELVEELLRGNPQAPIVLYTGLTGRDATLGQAARAGARGFVLKSSPPAELIGALRAVATGGTHVDPALAGVLSAGGEPRQFAALSPRERQILSLLADGLTGQTIAEQLFLSPETVRTHVRSAMSKLGAATRAQLVAIVLADEHAMDLAAAHADPA